MHNNLKKIHLILLGIIGLTISLEALSQDITGKVMCQGEAVPGAHISLKENQQLAVTDTSGKFSISVNSLEKFTLQITAIGYEKFVKTYHKADLKKSLLIELQETVSSLDEVVVSGTLREVSKLQSPVTVEVFTPKFFQKNPTPNLLEALQMVNSVRPQLNCSVCNTGDIHINGMEGPYTMVLIDGMPIVSSLSTVYGLSGIPNSMVERIEIVKGPNSSLYGSEAVAGVINVITKNPQNLPKLTTDIMITGMGDVNADIAAKKTYKKISGIMSANYYNYNRPIDINHDNFTDVTLQHRISLFNKWDVKRKNNRIATIAARYMYENRWGGEMQWGQQFRGTDSIYGESIYTSRYELLGQYQLPLNKEKVILSYSWNWHNQNSYYGTTPYMAIQQIGFAQLIWDKSFSPRYQLLSGIALRNTYYDDNTPATAAASNTLLPGIFVQNEWKITEKHTLLAGARVDHHPVHGIIPSPRINYKLQTSKYGTLRAGFGNGYRVVNLFTEDHAALTGARKVLVANALSPEKSINATLNYTHFINFKKGYLGLDAGPFYTYFYNKILADYTTDPNLIIYQNLNGYAISRGFSLNADLSFTSGLKCIAGITVMDVFRKENNVVDAQNFASPLSGNYSISYQIAKYKLYLDYSGNFYSPMPLPVVPNDFRPSHSPWYAIQNIQATYKYKSSVEIYGGIKNILNFLPQNPILRPFDPFDKKVNENNPNNYSFDTTYMYAPMQGRRFFVGIRWFMR